MDITTTSSLHIMMFPFLAFGHITPFLNLARKLTVSDPTLRVTVLSAPSNIPRITSLLSSSNSSNILIHPLPLPPIPEPPSGELDEKWAKWLSAFDDNSVLFCSFGSETFLKNQDLEELLLGLEMTKMPFLAVINHIREEEDFKNKLPEGFEERVKERGAVHCGWVQQQLSVGCFLNHAGFSSVIEGVVAGCRLVFLPQRGDQYLNSALFAGDLGIGVEVGREDGDGGFGREGVREAVRKAVEDEEVGRKWGKWREVLMDGEVEERCIKERG